MTKSVKKVVIAAAGLGTRFLPVTAKLPKELLPIIDKPTIQYVLEEALISGIEEIILVINHKKKILQDYLKSSQDSKFRKLLNQVKLRIVFQDSEYYGTGAPLLATRNYVGEEPFIYLFADSFSLGKYGRIQGLIKAYGKLQTPIISLIPCSENSTSIYGIAQVQKLVDNIVIVKKLVEKPKQKLTPPIFAAPNGYLLTPGVFGYLDKINLEENGELATNLPEFCQENLVHGVIFDSPFFEAGNKVDFVKTQLKMLFEREDLNESRFEMKKFILEILEKSPE